MYDVYYDVLIFFKILASHYVTLKCQSRILVLQLSHVKCQSRMTIYKMEQENGRGEKK